MAEQEYSDVFAVFVTPLNGLKPLVNPTLVKIAETLLQHEMTIADLVNETGISRSTVSSSLKRLCDMGIVTMRKSTRDARETLFVMCAIEVVSCAEPDDYVLRYIQRSSKARMESQIMPIYDAIMTAMAQFRTLGVSIIKILFEAGFAIGMAFQDHFKGWSESDVVAKVKGLFNIPMDLNIRLDDEGMCISIGPGDIQPIMLFKDLFMGFMTSIVNIRTGRLLSVMYETHICESGDCVSFRARWYSEDPYPLVAQTYTCRDTSFYGVSDPFIVVFTSDGSHYMITNVNMIKVMMAISDGRKTPVDISHIEGISHIMVHSVLNRLEAIGVLTKVTNPKGIFFESNFSTLICGSSVPFDSPPPIDTSNIAFDSSMFRGFVYRYMFWVADNFSIGATALFSNVGHHMGDMLVAAKPRMSAQDFLDSVCNSYIMDGADMTIHSYIPVYIILKIEAVNGKFAEYMGLYLSSMLERALEIITGDYYRVIVDVRSIKREGRIPAPKC